MRHAADRLSVRWYIGYDLGEPLPDHSSLTRIRSRYGVDVFRHFFEKIVEQCQQEGLVWGKELYFDGTKVAANAGKESLKPRFFIEAHLESLFGEAGEEPAESAQQETLHEEKANSVDEAYLDRVRAYQSTEAYKKALRKRQVWVEPLFAEAKDWHGMRRFRLRRLWRVNSEALMIAAGQNLKRLLKKRGWGGVRSPQRQWLWCLLRTGSQMNPQDATGGKTTGPALLWHPWSFAGLSECFLSRRRAFFFSDNQQLHLFSYYAIFYFEYSILIFITRFFFFLSFGEALSSQAHLLSHKLSK